jgi:hypothetical protein
MRYWHPLLLLVTQMIAMIWIVHAFNIAKEVYPLKYNVNSVHRTLYIDRRFPIEESQAIQRAATRWTETTNHIATVDVEIMPASIRNENNSETIIVLDVTPDLPAIIATDAGNKGTTCGLFSDREMTYPIIAIVDERIDTSDIFEEVIMHEIGHSLGLPHLEGDNNFNTLMYPNVGLMSPTITDKDLQSFCKYYHCDASKLKHEEESLHP